MKKVVIDAGHGYSSTAKSGDTGAVNGKHQEHSYNLKIAKKLGSLLKEAGYEVIYTRTKAEFITLGERVEISNRNEAQLFVSIHCNSSENKLANGIETFHFPTTDKITQRLAKAVQKYLVRYTGDRDRGVKTNSFYVLKFTKAKALLVECGFISHDPTAEKLATSEYQAKIAKGICDGIRELFG